MKGINKNILSTSFIMAAVCLSSCSDDADLGRNLEELKTISSITIGKTIYNTGDNTLCMLPGQNVQLDCTILPEDADDKNIKWTSSEEGVATITDDGLLTACSVGTSIVRVIPAIGFGSTDVTPSYTLNVVNHFIDITDINFINVDDILDEGLGQSTSYKVESSVLPENATFKRLKWESLTPEIATVDTEGTITAVAPGQATIKVTADDMSATPVSKELTFSVFEAIPVEGIEFKQEAVTYLSQLGYGESYDLKNAVTLTPANATVGLISWSSDNESMASVDKDGVLTVKTTTDGTAKIIAAAGPVMKEVTITVVAGRFCFSFGNGIGIWSLESGNQSSVVGSDGAKTTIKMGGSPKHRGDFVLTKRGVSQSKIAPSEYRYLAMKIKVSSALVMGSNSKGCIKLELWDDSGDNGTIGNNHIGNRNANNSFEILGGGNFSTESPNVIYWDLQGKYDKHTPTDWNKIFTLNALKFVIADYAATDEYDMYWIRSFKTVEELQAFVNSENNN